MLTVDPVAAADIMDGDPGVPAGVLPTNCIRVGVFRGRGRIWVLKLHHPDGTDYAAACARRIRCINTGMLNGLVTWSKAPRAKAASTSVSPACADSMMAFE